MSADGRLSDDEVMQQASSPSVSAASSRLPSRRQSRNPESPHKRRRLESVVPNAKADWRSIERHNDKYRSLYNEETIRVARRFSGESAVVTNSIQIGTSVWSAEEQSSLFKAIGRLGRDDILRISHAIGTKGESETRDFLLFLQEAAARQGNVKLTLRDIPAAIEIRASYVAQLEDLGDSLSRYQERLDIVQEQERYGSHWLITSRLADDIEDAVNGVFRPSTAERGGRGVAG